MSIRSLASFLARSGDRSADQVHSEGKGRHRRRPFLHTSTMRFELDTALDRETAFSRVADFANLETWDPFVKRSHCETGDPMTSGSLYRLESPGGLTLRYRILEIDRPHFVVYGGGTARVRSTDRIEVSPTARGSRVSITSQLEFSGRMRPFAPLVRALVWLGGRFGSFPALRRHLVADH